MSVSVVIPSYNRARRLPTALDSVLRQGQHDLEIIVVDDGSTDDTSKVAASYGDVVKYIYQTNGGVGAARNTGLRHATKEFIAFLDSDDRWYDYKLDVQLALFRARPDIGLVFSEFDIEKPGGGSRTNGASIWAGRSLDFPEMMRLSVRRPEDLAADRPWPRETVDCRVGGMYRQLLDELPVLTSSVIVRRSVLDRDTWYAERVALFEDWEFFARVSRRTKVGFVTIPTTANIGHDDAGRVSACSSVDRAESYLSLLERVWLSDAEFVRSHATALSSAHGRALLAVARESLLAGKPERARAVLRLWQQAAFDEKRGWAAVYQLCSGTAGGGAILRTLLKTRTVLRLLGGKPRQHHGSVNPAI
jgi:glycosyltransferase involved in cell wall biosynthesis